jgi:hypothetical protein
MSDTNQLIKDVAVDIICVTTMWSLLNNPYMAFNYAKSDKLYITPTYLTIFGCSVTAFILSKYL